MNTFHEKYKALNDQRKQLVEDYQKELEEKRSKRRSKLPDIEELNNTFEMPKCPECGRPLILSRITTPKGPSNLYGYKSKWLCSGIIMDKAGNQTTINDGKQDCIYEKYSTESVKEVLEKIYKETNYGS